MIHPSYSELIEAINTNTEDDDNTMLINSQIIAGSEPMVEGAAGKKPLSIAIDELYKGKVKILEDTHEEEEVSAEAASENTEEVTAEAETQEA